MSRFLVCAGRIPGAINLYKHEPRRIILLLKDIKSSDPWLFPALPRISDRGLLKFVHTLWLYVNMDEDCKHAR